MNYDQIQYLNNQHHQLLTNKLDQQQLLIFHLVDYQQVGLHQILIHSNMSTVYDHRQQFLHNYYKNSNNIQYQFKQLPQQFPLHHLTGKFILLLLLKSFSFHYLVPLQQPQLIQKQVIYHPERVIQQLFVPFVVLLLKQVLHQQKQLLLGLLFHLRHLSSDNLKDPTFGS